MSNSNDKQPLDPGNANVFDTVGVEALPTRSQGRSSHNRSNTLKHSHGQSNNLRYNNKQGDRSKSPRRSQTTISPKRHANSPKRNQPADLTVIVKRIDLWDTVKFGHYEEGDNLPCLDHGHIDRHLPIHPYHFAPDVTCWTGGSGIDAKNCTFAVMRVPHHPGKQPKLVPWSDVSDLWT